MSMSGGTDRRSFLEACGLGACVLCGGRSGRSGSSGREIVPERTRANGSTAAQVVEHDAMWFERLEDGMVRCELCPRECVVADVERGYCGVRENQGGAYKTLVYGALCSANLDPIEKKPLYHYLPGTTAFSVATAGCNIECKFCQNWEISQVRPEQLSSYEVPPGELVRLASYRDAPTIAYTYTEPVVFYEYVHDSAALARESGVGSVIISNGYILEEPLRQLCQHLTGVKIDLKAFTEDFYQQHCAGRLAPVLTALEVLADIGIHTEIVVLLIPTLNDSDAEIRELARWVHDHMSADVPVHFIRFRPIYRMTNLPPTPVATLERARQVAMDAGLRYVYLGNVPFHEGGNTYCHSCGEMLIQRVGFRVEDVAVTDGMCTHCRTNIPGVWSQEQALGANPRSDAY